MVSTDRKIKHGPPDETKGRDISDSASIPIPRKAQRDLLDARAAALAMPLNDGAEQGDSLEVLTFHIGDQQFALATRYVTDVIRNVIISTLPGDTQAVTGVTNLRGEVLATVSLADIFETAAPQPADGVRDWLVVIGTERCLFGLEVSQVTEVVSLAMGELLSPAPTSNVFASGLAQAVTADAKIVLDGEILMQDARFVVDDE